jgi:hypothetical protein
MKKFFLAFSLQILVGGFLLAQTEELLIKTGDKGLYFEHKVTPKENFYSAGRLFNVHPKHLAAFNGLDMSKGLSLGQVILIPLTDTNFSQQNITGTPIYYKVGEKEGLSRISTINNKVPIENLRKWNNISGDNIAFGTKLIVGFFISKEMPVVTVAKKEEPVVNPKINEDKIASPNAKIMQVVRPDSASSTSTLKEEKKPVKKEGPKKEEQKTVAQKIPESGYFKIYFDQQVKSFPLSKEETVTSGIFKTNNGWQDGKYYVLIDGVEPGTIIKVTNPVNNKFVFAKVLGEMKGIRQNQGLDLRISDAATVALEISELDKFIVKVNY